MSAAERKRLYRAREREGKRVLPGGFAIGRKALQTLERHGVIGGTANAYELREELEKLCERIASMVEYRQMVGLWNAVPRASTDKGELEHGSDEQNP